MTVAELVRVLEPMRGYAAPRMGLRGLDVTCTGVTHDSRRAARGTVFVGLRGFKADGAVFAPAAIASGAAAIVASEPPATTVDVPWFVVEDARLALALLAAEFYGHPSNAMKVIGITGTNGKTTTTTLIRQLLRGALCLPGFDQHNRHPGASNHARVLTGVYREGILASIGFHQPGAGLLQGLKAILPGAKHGDRMACPREARRE